MKSIIPLTLLLNNIRKSSISKLWNMDSLKYKHWKKIIWLERNRKLILLFSLNSLRLNSFSLILLYLILLSIVGDIMFIQFCLNAKTITKRLMNNCLIWDGLKAVNHIMDYIEEYMNTWRKLKVMSMYHWIKLSMEARRPKEERMLRRMKNWKSLRIQLYL